MSNLLINEPPLQVLPSLAVVVGLNEAIILQQVHYWMRHSKNVRDGKTWVYKTYDEWQEEFPFWSKSTIRRAINNLEKENYLIATDEYNKMKIDKTKWYTINQEKLMSSPCVQNEQSSCSEWADVSVQNEHSNNQEITQEITRENKTTNILFNSWWELYNNKKGKVKAQKSFENVLKKYPYDVIEQGTKKYLERLKREGTDKKYMKHPATFLNGEHFNDEYDSPAKSEQAATLAETNPDVLHKITRMDELTYKLEREDDPVIAQQLEREYQELEASLYG